MPRSILPLVALASVSGLAACNPQSADITSGSFTAMLSINTSQVFVDNNLRIDDFENYWYIDCRAGVDPIEGAEDNCGGGGGTGVSVGPDAGQVLHETWIDRDAFAVVNEDLAPWRGEAIQTSEGDIQLTFHHRLPGDDFRFAIVVDPNFQPKECKEAEDGSLSLEPIDGDWIGNWSAGLSKKNHDTSVYAFPGEQTSGTLIPLNANSYQFNPKQTTDTWGLPLKMEAGYARARFGPEEMFQIGSRYARPRAYTNFDLDSRNGAEEADLYFLNTSQLNPANFEGPDFEARVKANTSFINMMTTGPEGDASETNAEFEAMHAGFTGNVPNYTPFVPSNAWRQPNEADSGFDRWGEVHYNWIRFDQPRENLVAGEAISGEFRLYFVGANSQSHLLVEGRFDAGRVRMDTWVVPDVQAEKAEEAGVDLCGGSSEG